MTIYPEITYGQCQNYILFCSLDSFIHSIIQGQCVDEFVVQTITDRNAPSKSTPKVQISNSKASVLSEIRKRLLNTFRKIY